MMPWALSSLAPQESSRVGPGAGITVPAAVILVSFSSCQDSNLTFKTTKQSNQAKKETCVNPFLWITLQRHKIKTCLMSSPMRRIKLHEDGIDMKNSGSKVI